MEEFRKLLAEFREAVEEYEEDAKRNYPLAPSLKRIADAERALEEWAERDGREGTDGF
jgi:hypothetical protein